MRRKVSQSSVWGGVGLRAAAGLVLVGVFVGAGGLGSSSAEPYAWQQDYAEVDATGAIRWKPQAYTYEAGSQVRYIDFEAGDDSADGATPDTAWKHHPWDEQAAGRAAAVGGADTFVFKRGVIYRGSMVVPAGTAGRPNAPVRLTSDPSWGGEQPAWIVGSEVVADWQPLRDHPTIPQPRAVHFADLDFAPRAVWVVDQDGGVTRLPLARTPNWRPDNLDDIKSDWWQFDNPKTPQQSLQLDGEEVFYGTDTQHLDLPADAVEGAYLWSEYGWVMGTPYAARVLKYDPAEKSVAFEGQWGRSAGGNVLPRYSRYYLEDKPHFLDDPAGEFWFDKQGRGGRLYVRLPRGVSPESVRIEVARRSTLIDATDVDHLHVSGLGFRWTNTYWDLHAGPFMSKDVDPAAIRLQGRGQDLQVRHCVFESVNKAVRVLPAGDHAVVDRVLLADNDIRLTDHGAVQLWDGSDWGQKLPTTRLLDVKVLRNRLTDIGLRPTRYGQGHAIDILCAQTAHVAGNVLDRLYGAGIFVYGGKRSGAQTDRPFSRILIHQNQVTNPLLNNNDWGGIETWQGGPSYVFNNVSGNPGGFKLWGHRGQPDKPGSSRFGHAYYMDGAFKQYYFNNIAWGKNNNPASPRGNTAAFQEIHSFLDYVFNNTAYNFVIGSRRQAPAAGQNKYLGNIWDSIGYLVFRHAEPSGVAQDPNAADAGKQASEFEHATNAYAANLFHDPPQQIAVFEPSGNWYGSVADFAQALQQRGSIGQAGETVDTPLLMSPEAGDFRPTAAARDRGVRVFVPWSLHGVVGEWHFYPAGDDPAVIPDEHFQLSPYYVNREEYHSQPRYPLHLKNGSAESYVAGPLEDWTDGALRLDGQTYAELSPEQLAAGTEEVSLPLNQPASDWLELEVPESVVPGRKITVRLKIKGQVPEGQQIKADLHWASRSGSGGGFNANGGPAQPITGPGPYEITFNTQDKNRLGKFTVAAYISPDGSWGNRTHTAFYDLAKGVALPEGGYRSPDVDRSNLLIETYLQVQPGQAGAVVSHLDESTGYALRIDPQGRPVFQLRGEGQSAELTAPDPLEAGRWHHVLVEADRDAGTMKIYVDGRAVAQGPGLGPVSIRSTAPLWVGRGSDGQMLRGQIEFLRIAAGTLAQSQTTIEELHAWQFDGPFLRDFAGQAPTGPRDAGALELVE